MNDRQRIILKMALSFMMSNMDQIRECFENNRQDLRVHEIDKLDYNGELIEVPTSEEMEELMVILN